MQTLSKRQTAGLLACLSIPFSSAGASAQDPTCADLLTSLVDESSRVLPDTNSSPERVKVTFDEMFRHGFGDLVARPLTEDDIERQSAVRPSIASFPWSPEERQLVQTHELPTADSIKTRLERTKGILASKRLSSDLEDHERALIFDVRRGRSAEGVLAFGELILSLALFREGRFDEMLQRMSSHNMDVTPREWSTPMDQLSHETFFRADEIRKIRVILRDRARAAMGTLSVDEAIGALERIRYVRPYERFVGGVEGVDALSEALWELASHKGVVERFGDREFILIRGSDRRFIVGVRGADSEPWQVAEPEQLLREFAELTAEHSTDDTEVWAVWPLGDTASIFRLDQVHRVVPTNADSIGLVSRETRNSGRSNVVLYVPKCVAGEGRALAEELARSSNSEVRLFVDDPNPSAVRNAESAADLLVSDDVAAVVPVDLGVIDGRVIQNLQDDLADSGITVVHFDGRTEWRVPPRGAVVVLSGHSAPELAAYVRDLASVGAFRDNHVVFTTCATSLTAKLKNEIMQAGAVSLFGFNEAVTSSQVDQLLSSMVEARVSAPTSRLVDDVSRVIKRLSLRGSWRVSTLATHGWEALV